MTSTLTLRRAGTNDARAIARHRYHRGESQEDLDAYAIWLPQRIDRDAYIGFVAENAGNVVAGVGAVLLDWGPSRGETSGTRARIVNVFTDEGWRRQGIARGLVERVMAVCAALDVRVFNLAASSDGARMYRSFGFEPYANEMILRRT